MTRYGICRENTYGVSIPDLRRMARELGRDHELAQKLWASGIHEARILASMIDDPVKVTEGQMENWAHDFDSWDVCDQCCNNLFNRTVFAHEKATEWTRAEEEYVKRAGFVLIATLAVHDKAAGDEIFSRYLPIIERESHDDRNFVKKAINWALRQIGKRNRNLHKEALETARRIQKRDSRTGKWIAADALRELRSEAVKKRLKG